MLTNIRLSGANSDPREESDIRINHNNLQQIISASTKLGGNQPMHFSTDGGANWSQSSLPTADAVDVRQGDPTIDWSADGTAWTVTIGIDASSAGLRMRCFKSTDQGQTWTFDSTVDSSQSAMDKQALWIDHTPSSPHHDNMYLIWHNGAPCFVSRRLGPAGTWQSPVQVSGSETTGTAIGADIKTNASGVVFAFWHDTGSRKMLMAKSTNGGSSFGTPITIATTVGAFQVGVPAQDERLVLIYASGGAYRTATEDLVYACWMDLAGGTGCDSSGDAPGSDVTSTCKTRIWFSRSTDGGSTWETPRKLNDQSSKNDQIFPRMAVDESTGTLMVVYHDTVSDSGRLKTDLWRQISTDHGVSWSAAARVTTSQTDETASSAELDFQYGDYLGLTGHGGRFFACWTDRRNNGAEEIWGAPLAVPSMSFIIDKSTFAKDEISTGSSYAPAYWLQLSGFSNRDLNLQNPGDLNNNPSPVPSVTVTLDPSLNTSLTAAQRTTISANPPSVNQFGPLPIIATDNTLNQDPQTFLYPFTISFNSTAALDALLPDQVAILTLNATFTVEQLTWHASANIELAAGEDPYFEDIDLNHPGDYPSWLSFDLRFFKMTVPSSPANQTASRFGAVMTTSPADAPGFIANVISNLTAGGGSVGADSFENGLSQNEDASALEFLPQDNAGNWVFNFAVARVRLKGNTLGAQAHTVRVFFRLFNAQTTSSEFRTDTTYRFQSDGVLNGVTVPLLGVQTDASGHPAYVTIPCFATPRVNLSGPADMKTQPEDTPNAQTINVVPGTEVDTFFGCWLDINRPEQQLLPFTPPTAQSMWDGPFGGTLHSVNDVITMASHQCLIAEIRYDDTPIPPGANSGTSDKLAQRNIAWINGPNPGVLASRAMPHPFDIRSTSPQSAMPDELMVLWGDTPTDSSAVLYLPSIDAYEVVHLSEALPGAGALSPIDQHTLSVPVGGVSFIPIPRGETRHAGLLTVYLPEGIKRGQVFTIVARQLTEMTSSSRSREVRVAAENAAIAGQTALRTFSWRRQLGAFQVSLVIKTKGELLLSEERLYAWLLWKLHLLPRTNYWHPIIQRYADVVRGRIIGFGGNPGSIQPSPTGDGLPLHHIPDVGGASCTGKVVRILFDRFGDFEGFILLTQHGTEFQFWAREAEVEAVVRQSWRERILLTVEFEKRSPRTPISFALHVPPGWVER